MGCGGDQGGRGGVGFRPCLVGVGGPLLVVWYGSWMFFGLMIDG